MYRLAEILSEQRSATRENVTRKQARTGEEREESDEEHGMSDDDSDDEEGDIPYNPKNLPLGWDGKVGETLQIVGKGWVEGRLVSKGCVISEQRLGTSTASEQRVRGSTANEQRMGESTSELNPKVGGSTSKRAKGVWMYS